MVDFNAVLSDARQLTEGERLRLIDALWNTVPDDAALPLHQEWGPEIERRMAAIHAGTATLIPWETIRDESLRRIGLSDDR